MIPSGNCTPPMSTCSGWLKYDMALCGILTDRLVMKAWRWVLDMVYHIYLPFCCFFGIMMNSYSSWAVFCLAGVLETSWNGRILNWKRWDILVKENFFIFYVLFFFQGCFPLTSQTQQSMWKWVLFISGVFSSKGAPGAEKNAKNKNFQKKCSAGAESTTWKNETSFFFNFFCTPVCWCGTKKRRKWRINFYARFCAVDLLLPE